MASDYGSFILKKIENDLIAVDFLWSIFVAALKSYRHDSVLRPFPSSHLTKQDGEKDFEQLMVTANQVRSLRELNHVDDICCLNPESLKLLYWVLHTRNFTLKSHSPAKFADIKQLTGQTVNTALPNYIIEVIYEPALEARFTSARNECKLLYAYHGSRLENFHSILHNGLHNHLNKNSLFGEGTYLSSELSMCMNYSPMGRGWTYSVLGEALSCIAVCETMDHPDVKSHTKECKQRTASWISNKHVPEKYYIVQNDELVRVKFILVYSEKAMPKNSRLNLRVLSNHFSLMIFYVVILVCIGLFNSRFLRIYFRNYFSGLGT